ncbi:hypothetical protein CAAN3_14S00232 [[Candida] anglica]
MHLDFFWQHHQTQPTAPPTCSPPTPLQPAMEKDVASPERRQASTVAAATTAAVSGNRSDANDRSDLFSHSRPSPFEPTSPASHPSAIHQSSQPTRSMPASQPIAPPSPIPTEGDPVAATVPSSSSSSSSSSVSSRTSPLPPTHSTASNQTVSLSTAGIRALVYQLQAIYIRTPVKLFRPSRFDYLAYVRELANQHENLTTKPYSIRTHSSLGMLFNVVRKEGWRFIPDKVLPPLLANSATGLILYASYLTALDSFTGATAAASTATASTGTGTGTGTSTGTSSGGSIPAYSFVDTWKAGFLAGAAQSLAAAPVDAIYTRSNAAEMLNGHHQNLWVYGLQKLREIGLVGVFAGYSFSLVKESLGFAFYFSTFETVKTRGYNATYRMVRAYRRFKLRWNHLVPSAWRSSQPPLDPTKVHLEQTRSTKILRSSFVLIAGASAAFSLLAVQYPLTKIQKMHLARLEVLDIYSASSAPSYRPFVKLYYNSYIDTYHQMIKIKQKSKLTWFQLGYKGFVRNALTTIPATSVGLLVFEIMRTKLSDSIDDGVLE